jgi:hypothetical protein
VKFEFAGIKFILHKKNIFNDNLPIATVGNINITTREAKIHLDNIIKYINNTVEVCAIFDEKHKKYSTALNFLLSVKGVFSAKTPQKLTEEAAKITIDVVKEIALMSEPLDDTHKKAISSAAFIAKFAIERVGDLCD